MNMVSMNYGEGYPYRFKEDLFEDREYIEAYRARLCDDGFSEKIRSDPKPASPLESSD